MTYACHPDHIPIFGDNHVALLVQSGLYYFWNKVHN
jgi:hypothetical protein